MIQSIIEKTLVLINTSLYQDPSLVAIIEPWFGHVLNISVQGIRYAIWLQVTESGLIYISQPLAKTKSTMIHAAPSVWLAVLRSQGKQQNAIPQGMHIAGDVGFALALFRALSRLEIDWLSHFSESCGGLPTFGVQQFAETITDWLQQGRKAHAKMWLVFCRMKQHICQQEP